MSSERPPIWRATRRRRHLWTRALLGLCLVGLAMLGPTYTHMKGTPMQHGDQPHSDPQHKFPPNRLIHETSPYLLQHAYNPVQWYPWGPEAFAKAKREDKPIFLSVGYSTCYWCHVMEKECFEREDVAEILNAHFVPIKVDREERPDVDKQYMLATQLMTGSGGWPNSVWLTPEGRPWMAGTYFPRNKFIPLLHSLKDAWSDRRPEVEKQADQLAHAIKQASAGPAVTPGTLEQSIINRGLHQMQSAYDPKHGGFQGSPKFPPHGGLALLIDQYSRTKTLALLPMITRTLDGMQAGGMHDHIGGGFHRYAVDDRWFLPHFEKMLYDNAQLMRAYTDAFELTQEARYRDAVEGIYRWLVREMVGDGGGFYSAIDAGEVGEEGEFYTWDEKEVRTILGEPAGKQFCDAYGFDPAGNWTEQASGEKPGTNIPVRPIGSGDTDGLKASRETLLTARNGRTHPHTDDKVLAGWNGLMIGALARAGEVFDEPRYTKSAVAAAEFIHQKMTGPDGKLLRSYRAGQARQPAYLDDYAYLAVGLLDLYDATDDKKWLDRAKGLAYILLRNFQDETAGGFYFSTQDHDDILLRSKNLQAGGNVPSANGMAAIALLRLGTLTGQLRYTQAGQRTLESMYAQMVRQPTSSEAALLALAIWLGRDPAATKPVKTRTPDARQSLPPVTVELFASATRVTPGATIDVTIGLDIADPWHIYATSPDAKFLLPTRVTLDGGKFIQAGELHAPKSISKIDAVLKATVESYAGRIVFRTTLAVSKTAPKGPAPVTVTIQYQPCNNQHCLPPETVQLVLPITIE